MTTATVLPCTNCGSVPQQWRCESEECNRRAGFANRKEWNHRQAGNAVLRLIERYKEKYNGVHPTSLSLPIHYIDALLPEFRQRIFAVRLVAKPAPG